MGLHTRDDGTGFSASLILIPSLLHYSFKAGQEKETEPFIKRWIKAQGGRRGNECGSEGEGSRN